MVLSITICMPHQYQLFNLNCSVGQAAFVPSVDNVHDTSYFTSRQCWDSAETRLFADYNYDSSDGETSVSGGSTSSSERPEDSVSNKFEVYLFEKSEHEVPQT